MRLTSTNERQAGFMPALLALNKIWVFRIVTATLVGIFCLDRATGSAPVQHLYYLPIILSGLVFGSRGGVWSAVAAIACYHFANNELTFDRLGQTDGVQVALFLAVGAVAGRVSTDARKIHRLALTDDLTGLRNLRSFEAELGRLVAWSRKTGLPLAMLAFDVDRLKALNDQHGHLAGSEAVRTVGRIVGAQFGPDAIACRYGGDEFALALLYATEEAAEQQARDLCKAVQAEAPVLLGRVWPAGTLSISVGVASRGFRTAPPGDPGRTVEEEGEDLFRAADEALYRAKANGRNRVEVACHADDAIRTDRA